jgi:hypothetical protein
MALEYQIDYQHRLVIVQAHGILTNNDVFTYQQEVWSQATVSGYDELIDMSDVGRIVFPQINQLKALAALSASTDVHTSTSKTAIVAPGALAFGIARMYKTYRELNEQTNKLVNVFRIHEEAML